MDQRTFADLDYDAKKRKTRREKFLERMDALIPWSSLEHLIRPHYPKGTRGRPPYPLSVMLRIHCVQCFYNLSDPAMEDMLYEIESVRRFVGVRLSDRVPDETTILNFRHLLEEHKLGARIFKRINLKLEKEGLLLREGTIVDASILEAPSSTKNRTGERDPEMHQTRKGNQWHFGMKMHIGVDEALGAVHSVDVTAANVSDVVQAERVLHGDEEHVWGDAGYRGIEKRPEHSDRKVEWWISERPGVRKQMDPDGPHALLERLKASTRAKVEHPFRYVKRVFGYSKVRYRGLAKNAERVAVLCGFANLLITSRYRLA